MYRDQGAIFLLMGWNAELPRGGEQAGTTTIGNLTNTYMVQDRKTQHLARNYNSNCNSS